MNVIMKSEMSEQLQIDEEFVVGIEEFEEVCRTCLSKETDLLPLTKIGSKNPKYRDILEQYCDVDMVGLNLLPKRICMQCVKELDLMNSFLSRSKAIQKYLNELVQTEMNLEEEMGVNVHPDNQAENQITNDQEKEMINDDEEILKIDVTSSVSGQKSKATPKINIESVTTNITNKYQLSEPQKEAFIKKVKEKYNGNGAGPVACTFCYKIFGGRSYLQRHRCSYFNADKYEEKIDPSGGLIKTVIEPQDVDNPSVAVKEYTQCDRCGYLFTAQAGLKNHYCKSSAGKATKGLFKCFDCGLLFRSKESFRNHMQEKHHKVIRVCKWCDWYGFSKFEHDKHITVHQDIYKCDKCNKTFTKLNRYQAHRMAHSSIKHTHKCDICQKKFARIHSLNWHLRSHLGYTSFTCLICDQEFQSKRELVIHENTHMSESFYCSICDKPFSKLSAMKKHELSHLENEENAVEAKVIRTESIENVQEATENDDELETIDMEIEIVEEEAENVDESTGNDIICEIQNMETNKTERIKVFENVTVQPIEVNIGTINDKAKNERLYI